MSVNSQQSSSCPIPSRIDKSEDWPQQPYSQTPGGTLFSTTPGGTLFSTTPGGTLFSTTPGGTLFSTTPGGTLFSTTPGGTLFSTTPGGTLFSTTPGGTLFSTTPGGTKIIYDRKFLLECRNSPIARTPPCCLPHIPGVTVPLLGKLPEGVETSPHLAADDDQFLIDI